MPENQSAFMFMQRIPHKLRVEREWPEQTRIDSLRMMKWTLRCGKEILEEIEMLDYPGELYRLAFGEHTQAEADAVRAELDEFLKHLTEADTLVVLMNLADLVDLAKNPRNAETVWITRGIFDFAQKLPNLKHRMLAFTQADRYTDEISRAGGIEALYAGRLPMLKTLYPELKVFTVSAVNGMDAEGRPKPDYSVAGCYEFMQEVLVDRAAPLGEAYVKCGLLLRKLNDFNAGSPQEFNQLVEEYIVAYNELKAKAQPFRKLYENSIHTHYQATSVYYEFRQIIKECVQKHRLEELSKPSLWTNVFADFDGCGQIAATFACHYQMQSAFSMIWFSL